MENVTSLRTAAYVIIFCLAGFGLLYQYRTLNGIITTAKTDTSNQNIVYEQYIEEISESKVTYSEIIASLLNKIDYDVQVNDTVISKDDFNYQEFDFSSIPEGEYSKSYEYGSSGEITKVTYELNQG